MYFYSEETKALNEIDIYDILLFYFTFNFIIRIKYIFIFYRLLIK